MLYDKKKDASPEITVSNIKNILKTIGIVDLNEIIISRKIDEHVSESVIVSIPEDISCSANGKGTNLAYAKASAYGEFMERLQNGGLFNTKAPDMKKMSTDELLDTGILNFWFNQDEKTIKKYLSSVLDICSNFANYLSKDEKCVETVPFYHFNKDVIAYIPMDLLQYTGGFTGSCAGNTPQEALVEGLSEVFERFIIRKAIKEPLAFPDIPPKIYMKWDTIKNIIDYLDKLDFDIIVKDASLDGKYPVACAVVLDRKTKGYYVWFGAHPSLPIAIERCFTEILQGVDLSNRQFVNTLFKFEGKKDNPILDAKIDNAFNNRFLEVNSEFFIKKSDYLFKEENWLPNDNLSNSELLIKMIKLQLDSEINVFIRDVSFLGFPSYVICIPALMTNLFDINPSSGIDLRMNYYKSVKVMGENISINLSPDEILDFFKYYFHLQITLKNEYKNLEMLYIITLIHTKKYKSALNAVNALKTMQKYSSYSKMFSLLAEYLNMIIMNTEKNIITNRLKGKYGKYFTSKILKIFTEDSSFENAVNTLKKTKLYSLKHISEEAVEKKQFISAEILEIYKKNIPNQYSLKNLLIS